MEFADFRDYQPGDDVRYVDPHVFARHQRAVVRRYVVDQQLPVHVLLDLSASMERPDVAKAHRARVLAGAAAAIAVLSGDHARLGCFTDGALHWFPALRNASRLGQALAWLASHPSGGTIDLATVASRSTKVIGAHDLVVVISDFMVDGVPEALRRWAAAQIEVFAVQVLSPTELDPRRLDGGRVELHDAETGATLDVALEPGALAAYDQALASWRADLARSVAATGGRWSTSSAEAPLDDVLFRAWRRDGLVT